VSGVVALLIGVAVGATRIIDDPDEAANAPPPDPFTHVVVEGDTLAGIAQMYLPEGVDINEFARAIAELNGLDPDNPILEVEMTLILPPAPDPSPGTVYASVTGRVLTSHGAPFPGIFVYVCPQPDGLCTQALTDDEGAYTARISPGTYIAQFGFTSRGQVRFACYGEAGDLTAPNCVGMRRLTVEAGASIGSVGGTAPTCRSPDLNRDDEVNDFDLNSVRAAQGSSSPESVADLDCDGDVDETDVAFVELFWSEHPASAR
jgi:hypothetical protein